MDLIADTTYLVGIWRRQSWAIQYASSRPSLVLGIPWVVLGEFWHGAVRAKLEPGLVADFLNIGQAFMDVQAVIPTYASICASLQEQAGWREIGQNDLWIGACALAANRPLLTRNRRHFERIPGLRLEIPAS